jgi:hypothetical protein
MNYELGNSSYLLENNEVRRLDLLFVIDLDLCNDL